MACTFFEEDGSRRCAAVRGVLIPSVYEREHYCRTDDAARCPTFRARCRRSDALPEELYYAIWLPLGDELDAPDAFRHAQPRRSPLRVLDRHVETDDVYSSCTALGPARSDGAGPEHPESV